MKKLIELIETVRVEENKYSGDSYAFFGMKHELDGEWIQWQGDTISPDATPIHDSLEGIWDEHISAGREVNILMLKDFTGLSKSEILEELKALEEIWIEKFNDIKAALDMKLTVLETVIGGEC